ncbi:hypothetical protein PGQ11_000027 [Apiospora arundinis]
MRPRHLVLAATIVSGSLAGMSSCVRSCYSATVYFLGCNPGDIACACKQQPNLMYYAEPCLIQECRNDDLLLALTSMKDLCSTGVGAGTGTGRLLPPATQSPTDSFSFKAGTPPNPTTISGTTVVISTSLTRTIEPITIQAQQSPITITPPGAGSGGGGGGGRSPASSPGKDAGPTGAQGSNGAVAAWRVEAGVVVVMCVGLVAVLLR